MIGESLGELIKYVFQQEEKSADAIRYMIKFVEQCRDHGKGQHMDSFLAPCKTLLVEYLKHCPLTTKTDKVSPSTILEIQAIRSSLMETDGGKEKILSDFMNKDILTKY
jgi:hypothetical protein